MMRRSCLISAIVFLLAGLVSQAGAVIVLGGTDLAGVSDNSGRNLNPAPFNLDNYVFLFGNTMGTPIAPQYFVTAVHVGDGGSAGNFTYDNGTPVPTAYSATLAGTQNDLAIWKLNGTQTFSLYAPLYTATNSLNQPLVTIGRGTQRGGPINNPNGQAAGWNWAADDRLLSWGTGTIAPQATDGGTTYGQLLSFAFTRSTDANGNVTNPNQGIFSTGDSGGPTFVYNSTDQQYELSGINSLVDTVNQPPVGSMPGSTVAAAIYDARGFYDGMNLIQGTDPVPLSSYITPISAHVDFINSVITPEPGSVALLAIGAGLVLRRSRRVL